MNTSADARSRFSEGLMSATGEERRETAFSNGQGAVGVMSGRTASRGTAIGRAALVMDKGDIVRVKEGAIIISKTASPELAMVITKARALATEHGGQGAIASGFARQYGIPAVVGVAGLTKVIKDGDLVRVDGTKGTVEIMLLTVLTPARVKAQIEAEQREERG